MAFHGNTAVNVDPRTLQDADMSQELFVHGDGPIVNFGMDLAIFLAVFTPR